MTDDADAVESEERGSAVLFEIADGLHIGERLLREQSASLPDGILHDAFLQPVPDGGGDAFGGLHRIVETKN